MAQDECGRRVNALGEKDPRAGEEGLQAIAVVARNSGPRLVERPAGVTVMMMGLGMIAQDRRLRAVASDAGAYARR